MRIHMEPTDILTRLDGVECRVWNGVTEDGKQCIVFVHRIMVPDMPAAEFDERLIARDAPERLEHKQ